jgi:hypothetical protein
MRGEDGGVIRKRKVSKRGVGERGRKGHKKVDEGGWREMQGAVDVRGGS